VIEAKKRLQRVGEEKRKEKEALLREKRKLISVMTRSPNNNNKKL
jgi:hypothetical protein